MGTVLRFRPSVRPPAAGRAPGQEPVCEVVIFPGVRIERHDVDLSHRLRDSAGRHDFDGIGRGPRPRKTS